MLNLNMCLVLVTQQIKIVAKASANCRKVQSSNVWLSNSNLPIIISCVDKKDWCSYVVNEFLRKHTLQTIIYKKSQY